MDQPNERGVSELTTGKNIGPGADGVRHLEDPQLLQTVEIFERQAKQMPDGSEAQRIIRELAKAGREELAERAGRDGKG